MTPDPNDAEIETKLNADQVKQETKLRNERTNLRRLFTIAANIVKLIKIRTYTFSIVKLSRRQNIYLKWMTKLKI